jgi:hypothetical protein
LQRNTRLITSKSHTVANLASNVSVLVYPIQASTKDSAIRIEFEFEFLFCLCGCASMRKRAGIGWGYGLLLADDIPTFLLQLFTVRGPAAATTAAATNAAAVLTACLLAAGVLLVLVLL